MLMLPGLPLQRYRAVMLAARQRRKACIRNRFAAVVCLCATALFFVR